MHETSDVSHGTQKPAAKKEAVLGKRLVYLPLYVLISAIALIYKHVLLAFIYVIARLYPGAVDRDVVIDALAEVEKDSKRN